MVVETAKEDEEMEKRSEWERVMTALLQNAQREQDRWCEACWAAAGAVGLKSLDNRTEPKVNETYNNLARCRRAVEEMTLALALEQKGRLGGDLDAEVLGCFERRGAHSPKTITRRLFKEYEPEYAKEKFVAGVLADLVRDGRLLTRSHKRGGGRLYMPATNERVAPRKAAKERAAKERAAEEEREAKQRVVVGALRAAGCESAKAALSNTKEVVLSVGDLERLLERLLDLASSPS